MIFRADNQQSCQRYATFSAAREITIKIVCYIFCVFFDKLTFKICCYRIEINLVCTCDMCQFTVVFQVNLC